MTEEQQFSYSTIGPLSYLEIPVPKLEIPPISVDLSPLIAAIERLASTPFAAPEEPLQVNVAAPNVIIENKPMEHPLIEVHCPEPVVNINLPEVPPAAHVFHVEPSKVEVTVAMWGFKALVAANIIALTLTLGMAGIGFVYWLESLALWE